MERGTAGVDLQTGPYVCTTLRSLPRSKEPPRKALQLPVAEASPESRTPWSIQGRELGGIPYNIKGKPSRPAGPPKPTQTTEGTWGSVQEPLTLPHEPVLLETENLEHMEPT